MCHLSMNTPKFAVAIFDKDGLKEWTHSRVEEIHSHPLLEVHLSCPPPREKNPQKSTCARKRVDSTSTAHAKCAGQPWKYLSRRDLTFRRPGRTVARFAREGTPCNLSFSATIPIEGFDWPAVGAGQSRTTCSNAHFAFRRLHQLHARPFAPSMRVIPTWLPSMLGM